MKNLYVTGYKPQELNIFNSKDKRIPFIKEALKRRIIQLVEEEGIEWIIVSGQQGVELWAAEVTLELKEDYMLKLAVVPPFLHQEKKWKEESQEYYYFITEQADFYKPLTNREYESPAQFRMKNKWLVEKTDACVMLYEEEQKGSPTFFLQEVAKTKHKNYPIFFITSYDLEEVVREIQANSSNFDEF